MNSNKNISNFGGAVKLDYSGIGLDSSDAKVLAELLKANVKVQWLHVNSNALGQAGGEAFGEALQTNSTLDSIVIGSKDKPATIPLKELRENSIDALDYQGKELLAEGGIVLASTLKGNSSVTIHSNITPPRGVTFLL